ncbi:hypothetical protein CLAFUW4_12851 [Fulvia fulva]|uniref:Uncharacterized protein n=1 Tax=Passalora fulva TaxID=5499 RepID=A0A9Q8PJD7_PASFU|nr:uncharacterized protein CLAFUR5_12717 [Fulvia fulva]KAK4612324.1 hypothetical protein CLAFUR4_12855 [Fulvia fulva]KAK4612537.1 hypothetical protein CLAFUR0_12861 [Fulvia fulva]UJO23512.1 hypothetical protein CLAFUR5_12717 [Fulvia fulva]WPV21651.1 hypothetical protein CLAFUW4_12851 [Fulvia fulva]WPV36488.1 hypothetical protein CLAFUW7_12859 [Fulvia fulva]
MAMVPAQRPGSDMGPPRKKQRTEPEPEPAILSREMDDLETSLELDHMILDYLLYHAIDTCLRSREHQQSDEHVERALLQVDEFVALFKRRYGKYNFDAEMRFRQQLLQLVTLFTQRSTQNSTTPSKQALEALRERNKERARQWIGTPSRIPSAEFDAAAFETELPLPVETLEGNRARLLATLDIPAEDDLYDDAFYGTGAAVSLLDLLPMFMGVSAQCNALYDSNMKEPLMQLAATWMLQACLEQYCVFGASGTDAIDEAFAWGYKSGEQNDPRSPQRRRTEERAAKALGATQQCGVTDSAAHLINSMFERESGGEVDGWQDIREAALEELLPDHIGTSRRVAAHLKRKAEAHSYARAEEGFFDYFRALSQCIPLPILVQLERGQLEGMTVQETEEFIKGCGMGIMELLA